MSAHDQKDPGDRLFLIAESLAGDTSLFKGRPGDRTEALLDGLLSNAAVDEHCETLNELSTDGYCEQCVAPAEAQGRASARAVIELLGTKPRQVIDAGPLYAAEIELTFRKETRQLGVLAQNRESRNGVWSPEHHLQAATIVEQWSRRNLPILTFMDTPGADAEEAANRNNQAHSISRLIGTMSNLDVPTLGIVLGMGYSGGAIPLATTNLLLSVSDGVFSTIQPKGLASIARKYDLSWQECAKRVGVSAFELCRQ
ncbi:MAG: carboxyl transferase domain-containing protein, partial [Pseudomonadota bacterium]